MLVCSINAQNAAKNWMFGVKARINFNGSSPIASAESVMSTSEGSASISDSNGNLLFYTDGIKVWDRAHHQMPNGFGLTGNISSTQAALIVPCSCSKYFIFTTGAFEDNFNGGFRYSVVDLAENGGFGDVLAQSKNTMLVARASEKVAGVSDGNGGYWVVAHGVGDNRFYSYHISAGSNCALNAAPIISQVGAIYTNIWAVGQMKISPDGNRLAAALHGGKGTALELFRFDVITGIVSDLADTTVRDTDASNGFFYGVEFSPNSQALYASVVHNLNTIYRYDITSNTLSDRAPIFSLGEGYYVLGALQLAPDGKIYAARDGRDFLNVVNSPNAIDGGSVTQFALAPGSFSGFGLLSMVAGEFSCGASSGCCDQVKQTPFWTPDLSLAWKALEVFNVKYPSSDICSIDIDIRDAGNNQPPNPWNGGGLSVNGSARKVPAWWRSPYVKIPNGTNGQTVIDGHPNFNSPAVTFNLGLDYSGTYTGKVKLIIRHCNGTICEWVSENWSLSPPTRLGLRIEETYLTDMRGQFLPLVLEFQDGINVKGAAKWLAVEAMDEGTEVFSIGGGNREFDTTETMDKPRFVVASSRKQGNAALYEFAQTVNLERFESGEIKLVLKRNPGNSTKPRLRFIFFDENANIIGFATNEDSK